MRGYRFGARELTAGGPYEAPQIIVCLLVLALLVAVSFLVLPRPWIIGVVSVSFTAAWSVQAAARDLTGLWVVGAIGVLVGLLLGTAAVLWIAAAVRPQRSARRS